MRFNILATAALACAVNASDNLADQMRDHVLADVGTVDEYMSNGVRV